MKNLLTILIIIIIACGDLYAKESLSNTQIGDVYENFCYFADNPFPSDSLLKYYSILDQNKDILSTFIQKQLKSALDLTDKRYLFMVSGIFKLELLKDDIERLQSFDILFLLTQSFYLYNVTNSQQNLNFLKSFADISLFDNSFFLREAKIYAINLLGWINDDSVHDFLIGINKDGLVDAYSTIYEISLERIKILLIKRL